MARARNIKPSLFKNEVLGVADPLLTLLFESLWCLADREGRLEDRPLRIKAETFPYRECVDVNGLLTELQRLGFIERYSLKGLALIEVTNFKKHQSPHNTEKASELPGIDAEGVVIKGVSLECALTPSHNGDVTKAKRPDLLIPDSLIPDSGFPPTDSGLPSLCDGAAPPSPPGKAVAVVDKKPKADKEPAPTTRIWFHYAEAYERRYGIAPVRNAKVNGMLSGFLQRLGGDEAPQVAAWFVGHNNRLYVQSGHAIDLLVRDAEKLRTEWATGRRVTSTAAQEADRLQDAGDMWARIAQKHASQDREIDYGNP